MMVNGKEYGYELICAMIKQTFWDYKEDKFNGK